MDREYRKWRSPTLGKDMEMLIFGTEGTPVIIFPTENGNFKEWEEQGGIDVVEEQINSGFNQLFCVDSVFRESFFNEEVSPLIRMKRFVQFQNYILEEVLPFISEQNSNPFIINAGAGLGAYASLLLALKHPQMFDKVIGISGYYDINDHMENVKDDSIYYNNPVDFIPYLNDPSILNEINTVDIRLLSYQNDPNRNATEKMSEILWLKVIEHEYYVWDNQTSSPWNLIPKMLKDNLF